jgi:hypothetical protein
VTVIHIDKADIQAWPPDYRKPSHKELKPVWVAATGVRFYLRDGWTELELRPFQKKGLLGIPNPKDPTDMQYLQPSSDSKFDIIELARCISACHRHLDGMPDSVLGILKHFYGDY